MGIKIYDVTWWNFVNPNSSLHPSFYIDHSTADRMRWTKTIFLEEKLIQSIKWVIMDHLDTFLYRRSSESFDSCSLSWDYTWERGMRLFGKKSRTHHLLYLERDLRLVRLHCMRFARGAFTRYVRSEYGVIWVLFWGVYWTRAHA